jgi:type 2 lantibiotic biosynthesis protein LanM
VTILFFRSGSALVYKPRSTSIEQGFQRYLEFFNSSIPKLNLRRIRVINRDTYGWVEFVRHSRPKAGSESEHYHYKLGFLTAIVFSLNGVDIFFENLIAAGTDPVIIDLESMFHTPIDTEIGVNPVALSQLRLHSSVTGIGVLPNPGRGASETEAFDVTVLGAAVNARAPYNVSSIENFGRVDMKVTETPGWIHETTSSSVEGALDSVSAQFVFDGLKSGFDCIRDKRTTLCEPNGIIEQCFSGSERRLIVRDTKVYGSLQSDESHPDLLKDQSDREWHLDNLWSEIIERPNLLRFIESEIRQVRQGDIPYFAGSLDTLLVRGADGAEIDLEGVLAETPMQGVKKKVANFSAAEEREQLRLAATVLGLANIKGTTQPEFREDAAPLSNALEIVSFISRRAAVLGGSIWYDTSLNPLPAAKNIDPVNVVPSDPFLYEGVLGIAMFFYDVWRVNGDREILQSSLRFTDSVLKEVERNESFSSSGFVGLSSIVYVINRAIDNGINSYERYESLLPYFLSRVEKKIAIEKNLDFLLGVAGVSAAILPYVKRTQDNVGMKILLSIYKRLRGSADKIVIGRDKIEGLDYLRGFSHGLSGMALAIYRVGRFLGQDGAEDAAARLLMLERDLVLSGGWTDTHSYEGRPLVGWCHGSAGIVLALSQMPSITDAREDVAAYYDFAFKNTLTRYDFRSKCLCHGTLGNLLCLQATNRDRDQTRREMFKSERSLLGSGFKSLGAAQTMSAGLMTGLAGAGYYLLGQEHSDTDFGFLTLA